MTALYRKLALGLVFVSVAASMNVSQVEAARFSRRARVRTPIVRSLPATGTHWQTTKPAGVDPAELKPPEINRPTGHHSETQAVAPR